MANKSSSYAVKVKIVRENGKHCVKEVWGSDWRTVGEFDTRKQAVKALEQQLSDKAAQWSREVKMRGRWVCRKCGQMDKRYLDSHHIQPREMFPDLMYDQENGECDCLWLHAVMHADNVVAQNLILLRLVQKLTQDAYRPLTKCQRMLFGTEDEEN